MTSPSRFPSWLVLLLFFAAVVVLGSAIAPLLFELGHWYVALASAKEWHDTPLLGALAAEAEKADFQRYFNRAILVAALGLLWPAARLLKIGKAELPPVRPGRQDWMDAAVGFALAGGLLLAMGWLLLGQGVFMPNPKADWPALVRVALVAAAVVSLLEEWLFRGAFTAIVRRTLSEKGTFLFIAILFAVLHFMHPPEQLRIPDESVGAWTGFQLTGIMFGQLLEPSTFAGAFLTLLVVALLLGWARMRTGRLWLGIGLHAGWVFALKAFSAATRRSKSDDHGFPAILIGGDLRTGLLPLAFLAVTGLGLWAYFTWKYPRGRTIDPV